MVLVRASRLTLRAPRSIAELVDRRAKGSRIFEKLNVDLPDVAASHERVVMRPQPNSTPVAEIYVPHGTGPFPVLLHVHGGGWFAHCQIILCIAGWRAVDHLEACDGNLSVESSYLQPHATAT